MILQKLKQLQSGSIFVAATLISQVFNFLYNAYLGRALAFEDYALITTVINIWYFILLFLIALSYAITNRIASLEAHQDSAEMGGYYRFFKGKTVQFALGSGILWILFTPALKYFFHIDDWYALLMIAPLILFGAILSVNRGYLQARTLFTLLSITLIFESVLRLVAAYVIIRAGYPQLAYISIPVSLIATYALSVFLTAPHVPASKTHTVFQFPRAFFVALLLIGLSTTVFLTIDILLVKHYFESRVAGMYALLALVGKIIFFFSSLLTSILFTYASQGGKEPEKLFYRILAGTVGLALIAFVAFGIVGTFTVSVLFGAKADAIFPYLMPYSAAMSLFAITNLCITYYIAIGRKKIAFISLAMAGGLILSIVTFHGSLYQIVYSILAVSIAGALSVMVPLVRGISKKDII